MIDSSPMYGRAEAVTGDLLADLQARPRAFLATKVWTSGRERGIEQMRRSAALLRSVVVDLMQIHNLVDWRTHLATLRRMKEAGGIRYIGITHYTDRALSELAQILETESGIDFVQCGYSLAARAAERDLLPVAAARGVARHRQSAARPGRPVAPGTRSSPARLGAGIRLHELGAAVPQICSG